MNRLSVQEPGPNFAHYAAQEDRGFSENFFKQLTAEVLEKHFEKGVSKMAWKKIRERNEALDCAVYATAALELLSPMEERSNSKPHRADRVEPYQRGSPCKELMLRGTTENADRIHQR